jgi:hypothetical protein
VMDFKVTCVQKEMSSSDSVLAFASIDIRRACQIFCETGSIERKNECE